MRPPFDYAGAIMTPTEAGMTSAGSHLTSNLTKLGVYFTSGFVDGDATVIKRKYRNALGDRYFVSTGAMCNDLDSGEKVSRSTYLDFIPTGKKMSTTGLLPGIADDVVDITFFAKQTAMAPFQEAYPDCKEVTVETNNKGVSRYESAFLAVADLCRIAPGLFESGSRPAGICKEGFDGKMPSDPMSKVYLSAVSLLLLYIAMKLVVKKRA